jgi:hypothetical protein
MEQKAAKKPRARTIVIPIDPSLSLREVATSNCQVFHALRKRTNADIYHYAIPDKEGGIFLRRIRVVKSAKADIGFELEDLPDISDLHDTNMPWAGHCSLKDGSRQFNSKYVLSTVIDTVLEFENILYNLHVYHDPSAGPLQLFDLHRAGRMDTCHTVSVRDDIPEIDRLPFYEEPEALPEALVELLATYGYRHSGGTLFEHPDWSHNANGRINCVPYGVIREVIIGEKHVQVRTGS